jgi:PAS domain S-box-containing protein
MNTPPSNDIDTQPSGEPALQALPEPAAVEARARSSEARLRAIVDSAIDGIITFDEQGMVLSFNPAAARMLGYAPAEVIGCHVNLLMASPYREAYERYLAHYRAGGELRLIGAGREVVGRRKDGQTFPMELDVSEVLLGERRLFTGIVRDISARKRAEKALADSELRKAAIVASALDCIVTIDSAGRIIEFNPAAERTFGYSRAQALGEPMVELIIPPLFRKAYRLGLERYLATGEGPILGRLIEFPALRSDGTDFPAEMAVVPIRLGRHPEFTAYLRDISDRKQAARLRRQLLQQVMSAKEEEQRRIACGLHDGIGQSITSLLVGLQVLGDSDMPETVRQRLDDLHRQAASTLDEVRRLARGLRPLVLDELGLAPALERAAADFAATHRVAVDVCARDLDRKRLPPNLEIALYRIVQEALTNIAKHAAAQTVSIVVESKPGFVQLIVEDDGCGFDSEAVLREAGRFGLSSMQERAAVLDGSLTIESAPGTGTTIRVRIPLSVQSHGQDSYPHRR